MRRRRPVTRLTRVDRVPLNLASLCEQLVGADGRWRLDVVDDHWFHQRRPVTRHAAGEDITGAVLLAEHQSAGRGRNGRSWSAPPRSQIALSIGSRRRECAARRAGVGCRYSPASRLVDAVRASTGIGAGVKWPNDVLVGTGKLAGILAEVAAPDPVIVVGLGLNVTLTAEEAPDPRATSLQMLGASMLDREVLVGVILRELTTRIERWQTATGPDPALVEDYRQRSLTLGSRVRAALPGGREITGIAIDIDTQGRLASIPAPRLQRSRRATSPTCGQPTEPTSATARATSRRAGSGWCPRRSE